MLPRVCGGLSQDSEAADFPDGDALDGEGSAAEIIVFFVGLGLAAYGGYALVRAVLPLG